MPDKDINMHVKVKGTEASKKELRAFSDAMLLFGDSAEAAGDKTQQAAEQTDKLGDSTQKTKSGFDKVTASAVAWIAKAGSIAVVLGHLAAAWRLLTGAVRDNAAALDEHASIAERQQQRLSRLQYLGGFFKENPNLRKEVEAYAEFGGRPFEEVADAWYNLRSKSGMLSSQQQRSILTEALELGRTDTSVPLDSLVDAFSLYAKKSGENDANRIQNVIQQAITEAGGGGADVAAYLPRFLPVGMAGGLSAAESAGVWSYATTQTSDPSIATTGLRALFLGLQGKGSPESAKVLKRMGITQDQTFFSKIQSLSAKYKSGQFDLGMAEQIAGREGADLLLSMLNDPSGMMRTVGNITAVDRGDIDLAKDYIGQHLATDPLARAEEQIRQRKIAIENQKGSNIKALSWEEFNLTLEQRMRDAGYPEWGIKKMMSVQNILSGLGFEPGEFLNTGPLTSPAPTIINNSNVIYNHPDRPSRPRSSPEDLQ